jgi:hypothetical protein
MNSTYDAIQVLITERAQGLQRLFARLLQLIAISDQD